MRTKRSPHLIVNDLNTVISDEGNNCTTAHTVILQQPVTPTLLVAMETQFHKYTKEWIKFLSYYCNFYVSRYKVV